MPSEELINAYNKIEKLTHENGRLVSALNIIKQQTNSIVDQALAYEFKVTDVDVEKAPPESL